MQPMFVKQDSLAGACFECYEETMNYLFIHKQTGGCLSVPQKCGICYDITLNYHQQFWHSCQKLADLKICRLVCVNKSE